MTENLEITEAPYGSKLYDATVDLRSRLLREPLGLVFTEDQLKAEQTEIHIAGLIKGNLVGCVILVPTGPDTMKLRQMAVAPEFQGQKIGQGILSFAEKAARSRGITKIILHARETAKSFYEKYGYKAEGAAFVEVTIPHIKMEKVLKKE